MAAHRPADAPLATTFRGTDNAIDIAAGEDPWRSISGFASSHLFTDTESGQVVTFGALEAQGALHRYALRLKIGNEEVAESELLWSSSTQGHFRPGVLERRFPVLDIERGVAISFATVEFQPSGGRKDFGTFYICGLVKVADDEFRIIDHIHEILPRGTLSGW